MWLLKDVMMYVVPAFCSVLNPLLILYMAYVPFQLSLFPGGRCHIAVHVIVSFGSLFLSVLVRNVPVLGGFLFYFRSCPLQSNVCRTGFGLGLFNSNLITFLPCLEPFGFLLHLT